MNGSRSDHDLRVTNLSGLSFRKWTTNATYLLSSLGINACEKPPPAGGESAQGKKEKNNCTAGAQD